MNLKAARLPFAQNSGTPWRHRMGWPILTCTPPNPSSLSSCIQPVFCVALLYAEGVLDTENVLVAPGPHHPACPHLTAPAVPLAGALKLGHLRAQSWTHACSFPDQPPGEFLQAPGFSPMCVTMTSSPDISPELQAHVPYHLLGISTCWVCRCLKMKLLASPHTCSTKTPPS